MNRFSVLFRQLMEWMRIRMFDESNICCEFLIHTLFNHRPQMRLLGPFGMSGHSGYSGYWIIGAMRLRGYWAVRLLGQLGLFGHLVCFLKAIHVFWRLPLAAFNSETMIRCCVAPKTFEIAKSSNSKRCAPRKDNDPMNSCFSPFASDSKI